MRWVAIGAVLALGCTGRVGGSCRVCDGGCSTGLFTSGLVLTPPGCGSQCATRFCPGGCSDDRTCRDINQGPDGGLGSCVASHTSDGRVAITRGNLIIIGKDGADACDGGTLIIDPPPRSAGTTEVRARPELATRNGVRASSGSVSVNLDQPGGGRIGSYALVFPDGSESADFVAPECDVCATPP